MECYDHRNGEWWHMYDMCHLWDRKQMSPNIVTSIICYYCLTWMVLTFFCYWEPTNCQTPCFWHFPNKFISLLLTIILWWMYYYPLFPDKQMGQKHYATFPRPTANNLGEVGTGANSSLLTPGSIGLHLTQSAVTWSRKNSKGPCWLVLFCSKTTYACLKKMLARCFPNLTASNSPSLQSMFKTSLSNCFFPPSALKYAQVSFILY